MHVRTVTTQHEARGSNTETSAFKRRVCRPCATQPTHRCLDYEEFVGATLHVCKLQQEDKLLEAFRVRGRQRCCALYGQQ